jgi:hypothetical protein
VPTALIFRALTVIAIMLTVHFAATALLVATQHLAGREEFSFVALMFEAMNAPATVGLSTGIARLGPMRGSCSCAPSRSLADSGRSPPPMRCSGTNVRRACAFPRLPYASGSTDASGRTRVDVDHRRLALRQQGGPGET